MKKDVTPPKKPLIFYYIIVLVVLLLINSMLVPYISKVSIKEVNYNDFLDMLESGAVQEVQINENTIAFSAMDEDGLIGIYTTGLMNDSSLVDRLRSANVTFGQVVPEEASPVLSFLLGWLLPLVVFIGIGQLMMRKLTNKLGGGAGAMSFHMG